MQVGASRLIVLTGLPGCGKSTLADSLAVDLGIPAFVGDWLMGGLAPAHGALAGLDRHTYLEMYYSLVESLIVRQFLVKQSAVVDCMIDDGVSSRWQELVDRYDAKLFVVQCICSDTDEHRRRVKGRVRGIPGWHEVDWDHVERMRAEFRPLTGPCLTVDAVDPVEANLNRVRTYLAPPESTKHRR